MSKVLRASKSRNEDEGSPIKKPRKEDKPFLKKEDPKKKIELLLLQTLHNGKPKYCVFYTGSWLFPGKGYKCSVQVVTVFKNMFLFMVRKNCSKKRLR